MPAARRARAALVGTMRLGEIEVDVANRRVIAGTSISHLSGIEQSLLH